MSYELSENTLDYTLELLLQHCKNKQKFKKDAHLTVIGGEDNKDYTNKGIRRSRISSRKFLQTIFKNTAAAGSNFYSCTFDNCQIINANFQECTFIKSRIINNPDNKPIVHSNYNESLFADEFVLENNIFQHSVFYNTTFIGGRIENVTFYSCTLEGTTFSDVLMKNVTFSDLNIDYAIFENVKMQNVILPFSQICYTFGLLNYLKNTTDEVYITSAAEKKGYITKKEFMDLIPHFIKYYKETKDFFPLANIYFFVGDGKKAREAILEGILESVTETDFRRIKYLCKLIYVYGVFTYHERQEISDFIYSRISFYDMEPALLYNYTVYKKEIEGYLLSNNRKGIVTAEINITTNVFPEEFEKLGLLLSTIEEIIEFHKSPLEEHQIICKHNSAEALSLTIQEMLPNIIAIASMLYSVLIACYTLENKRLDLKSKRINLKKVQAQNELTALKTQLEIENLKQQLKSAQYENELKQIELDEKRFTQKEKQNKLKQEILSKNIIQNNIEISEIKHIIYGNISTQIDKDLIQYSYRNSNR